MREKAERAEAASEAKDHALPDAMVFWQVCVVLTGFGSGGRQFGCSTNAPLNNREDP